MGLRDIVGAFGVIPHMLAEKDKDKSDEISRLQTENAKINNRTKMGMKKGGMVKSSASKRADGIAMKGKTRGRMR